MNVLVPLGHLNGTQDQEKLTLLHLYLYFSGKRDFELVLYEWLNYLLIKENGYC